MDDVAERAPVGTAEAGADSGGARADCRRQSGPATFHSLRHGAAISTDGEHASVRAAHRSAAGDRIHVVYYSRDRRRIAGTCGRGSVALVRPHARTKEPAPRTRRGDSSECASAAPCGAERGHRSTLGKCPYPEDAPRAVPRESSRRNGARRRFTQWRHDRRTVFRVVATTAHPRAVKTARTRR